ncbi:MAG: hypothetical protein KDJ15_07990 [Alphaproteobacteria bacterium]|nr:hypothetical protein [Alphaproteobacteria bacterium]
MLGNKIDDTLVDMDFKSLYRMAEWHEKQSSILRARAQSLQEYQHMENQVAMRVDFLHQTPKTVIRYLKQGHTAERACQLAADHTGVPLRTINAHWKNFLSDKDRKATKQRNALILELHGLGLTNVNIADRLNLHAVTVSRILKKEKSKRIYNPNQERIALFLHRETKGDELIENRLAA